MVEKEKAGATVLTRRSFLKTTGLATAAVATTGAFASLAMAEAPDGAQSSKSIEKFNGVCRSNCNYGCRYWAHVIDGKIVKLEPALYGEGEDTGYAEDEYTGCCLKGLSYIERIYNPERIKYPMRRVGERGEDSWEIVSWDEALELIRSKFQSVIDEYGGRAIVYDRCTGSYSALNGIYGMFTRLASVVGMTRPAICYDYAAGNGINRVLGTGDWFSINEPNSVLDSNMIIVWGTNPVFTSPQTWRFIQRAKEGGAKVVCIDPIRSATAYKATEYLQVTPGNDGYLALAMANYIIEEDLIDHEFVTDKTTAAFLIRKEDGSHVRKSDLSALAENEKDDFYVWDKATDQAVLSAEAQDPQTEGVHLVDGAEVITAYSLLKDHLSQYTLSEAERICGVPEERIKTLAEQIATMGPVSVNITYGTDHYTNGHLTSQAIATLLALTGNLAKAGAGFAGVFIKDFPYDLAKLYAAPDYKGTYEKVPGGLLHEVIRDQSFAGQPFPVKAMISAASNAMSNMGGQNNFFTDILPNLDFWVVVDMEMTDSARHADLVLPCASWYEEEDLYAPYNHPYTVLQEKAIDPLYECKSDVDIACEIGRALGYEKSFPKDYQFEDWAHLLIDDNKIAKSVGMSLDYLKEHKYLRTVSAPGHAVVRGVDTPFGTESGRAQLYCEKPVPRINYGQDLSQLVEAQKLAHYRAPQEAAVDSALRDAYPLVFLQEHSRFRTHSQWFNVPVLRELDPEPLAKMSGEDAAQRGIQSGDVVEVYNDRGHAVCTCLVDESIAPGVVSIPKGWQRNQFVAGGFQEMTNPNMDPYTSTFGFYDTLVDVRKYQED